MRRHGTRACSSQAAWRPGTRAACVTLIAILVCCGPACLPLTAYAQEPAPAAAPPTSLEASPILARLRARLDAGQSFQSSFRQVSVWSAFGEADTSSGTLTVSPPDRFRLEYDQPAGHRIGSDGRYVWTFLPEDRQVLRAHIEETTSWGQFFYEGLGRAADSLATYRNDPRHGRVAHIALRARPEWGVGDLFIEVAVDQALPVGYGYRDEEGNAFSFTFLAPRMLASIPEEQFRFRIPEGYELFEVD